jgi:hypothetical protein
VPVSHAHAAVSSLLVMPADITDPRDPRGVRHRLVAVLRVAVVAALTGAASYRELGSAAAGLPQESLPLLGARWDLAGLAFIAPQRAPRYLPSLSPTDLILTPVPCPRSSRWRPPERTARCPILGAEWERRDSVRRPQMRSS